MYSPRELARPGKESVTFTGKLTGRPDSVRSTREGPGLRVQKAQLREGKRVAPAPDRRWGCLERAGSIREESREAGQESGQAAKQPEGI